MSAVAEPGILGDLGGLVLAAITGLILVAVVQLVQKRTGRDFAAGEIVFFLVPIAAWLFLSGHISKLSIAGVQLEASEAILAASRQPVEDQVSQIDEVVDRVEPEHREAKGATSAIPDLVERRIEALEFRLGLGGYYVGSAVREYLETLSKQPSFRYVVIFEEHGGLFGIFDEEALTSGLGARPGDGFTWFAEALNSSGDRARHEIQSIPGFVPGSLAITPRASKREALEAMEQSGVGLLPVVSLDRGFVGVVERDRLTASLILDVTSALEEKR